MTYPIILYIYVDRNISRVEVKSMDVQSVLTAISTVGFPIVACCGLFWFSNKMVDKMTETVQENTIAINKLSDKLEGEKNAES